MAQPGEERYRRRKRRPGRRGEGAGLRIGRGHFTRVAGSEDRQKCLFYFTFRKIMAKVYSAIDSIRTSARRMANRMAGAAPGFRAKDSQAEDVALACA